jgi:hypothetical protein
MVGLFVVAAGVSLLAIPPSLVLGSRPRMLASVEADPDAAVAVGGADPDGSQGTEPGIAL